ncbi:MAG TPA: 4-alpha-glucanotransferase [Acidimicrobiales bacterium]|jgi:4-alpha-glucanotransferase|nr:4-alpha-glucanotransferase [Acidimicrobiales bacterium]
MSSPLRQLAVDCGIELSFQGSDGVAHGTDDDTVLAILMALGVPIDRAATAPDVLRARRSARVRRVVDPVLVHRQGRTGSVAVTLPEHTDIRRIAITIDFEDGDTLTERLIPAIVGRSHAEDVDGARFHRYQVDLAALRPEPIPAGYHEVALDIPGSTVAEAWRRARLIGAPPCPQAQRVWGVFLPLHALRSDDDWGIGSYTDLAELGRWIDSLGGDLVGGLPLYPSFLEPPIDPSPYRPVSRLAYNELFINPSSLPELAATPGACHLLGSSEFTSRLEAAHLAATVDYETVAGLRRQVLQPMAEFFFSGPSPRRDACDAFFTLYPELQAYATFRAQREGGTSAESAAAVNYHLYCQWAAAEQLEEAARTLPLYGDLPIGVHPDGFDPFWSPISFATELEVGAPPDSFFSGGQRWGFPPLQPHGIREDGYDHVVNVLHRAFRHSAYLRVDHVMGLQRLYVIPAGADAQHGAYVRYQPDELHALVSLEAHRAGAVVVGEDLGTVPDGVRERMAADHMLRSWVFQFESSTSDPLPAPPSPVLASLGTHDLPRFAAHLWGEDLDEQEASGQLDEQEVAAARAGRARWRSSLLGTLATADHRDDAETTAGALRGCLLHLSRSPADVVLADLEDVWGEHEPQNRPGTGPEAGNWRRRGALTLAQAITDETTTSLLSDINLERIGANL